MNNKYTFHNLPSLEIMEIASNVTLLDTLCIECPNLATILVDEANENFVSVDGVVYTKDTNELVMYPNTSDETTITFSGNIERNAYAAFYTNTSIKTVIIKNDYAGHFNALGFLGLEEIIVESENENYKSVDGVLYSKDGTILIKYPAKKEGTSFEVPNSVVSISNSAFSYNAYLEEITLPSTLFNIEMLAFSFAESLEELIITETVEYLGSNIIVRSSITSLIIERSVVEHGSITSLNGGIYRTDDLVIYVPSDSLEDYRVAMVWKNIADLIEEIE